MRIGTPGFIGARLTEAREARGLTQTLLSERTGLKPQSICHYEQWRQSPSPEALALLCNTLDVPLRFFLRAGTGEAGPLGWLYDIGAYVARYVDLPAARLPRVPLAENADPAQVESAAEECRRALDLGSGPISELTAPLERAGCLVGAGKTAQAAWILGVPCILAESNTCALARAAGLLATGLGGNAFARALLLPAATFGPEVWAPTLDALLTLTPVWNCPAEMMIRRCAELGLLDSDQARRAHTKLARRGEAAADGNGRERPTLLARSIRLLIEGGVKDRHAMLHDLALAPRDVEELTCLPANYLTEGPAVPAPELRLREEAQNFEGSIRQTL